MTYNSLSPMMQHYMQIKEKYKDALLFYRLGDFYEMFFEDAKEASRVLDLTLTGRDCGLEERAPMCGVPHHAVDNYIKKLIDLGYKVAICEQLSTPSDQKGMVKRDVVRVISAGTVFEDDMLEAGVNNYLLSVYFYKKSAVSFAWADISTGELNVAEFDDTSTAFVEDFILKISPSEVLTNEYGRVIINNLPSFKQKKFKKAFEYYEYSFDKDNAKKCITGFFKIKSVAAFGLDKTTGAVCALGGLLKYIEDTQKITLKHIQPPKMFKTKDTMLLDYNTKKNLELIETLADRKTEGSLLSVLNKTKTAMGLRLLRRWLTEPLQKPEDINNRLNAVKEIYSNQLLRQKLCLIMSEIRDVERITSKISYKSITPRECIGLITTLKVVPILKELLSKLKSAYLNDISKRLDPLTDITELLIYAINEIVPNNIKDGGVIKNGYCKELDELRDIIDHSEEMLKKYENEEREKLNLKTLKIGFNKVFGYFIEVSNTYVKQVPESYERKQTLSNCERYVTTELKAMEEKMLGASERAQKLEESLYDEIKCKLLEILQPLINNARGIAELDVLYSFASSSFEYGYVMPVIKENSNKILIIEGRHPVVEAFDTSNVFVPNDANLDDECRTLIITGPNMAGKSTYMRQIALIVLMAHIGCFVPAKSAEISIVDRIFTRIGASDNLAYGQSTFMVEMIEMANILNNATDKSLLILDEIGRGTSTLDGLSMAWSIVEDLSIRLKSKTLFATHFHELQELESILPNLKNYHVLIKESKEGITFLYKISRGSINKSFGIEVGSLAGIPKRIIERSKQIMKILEDVGSDDLRNAITGKASKNAVPMGQIQFFDNSPLKELESSILEINTENYTYDELTTSINEIKKQILLNRSKRKGR